jgi:hypothetical protein
LWSICQVAVNSKCTREGRSLRRCTDLGESQSDYSYMRLVNDALWFGTIPSARNRNYGSHDQVEPWNVLDSPTSDFKSRNACFLATLTAPHLSHLISPSLTTFAVSATTTTTTTPLTLCRVTQSQNGRRMGRTRANGNGCFCRRRTDCGRVPFIRQHRAMEATVRLFSYGGCASHWRSAWRW